MPLLKDGSFLLDDSSCTPYTNMCNEILGNALDDRSLEPYKVPPKKDGNQNKLKTTGKKSKKGKKK